jgi:hypothetical protein
MSVKQKKILGNFIAIGFVLMIIFIIAFLSTISYTPPEIPIRIDKTSSFNWGDIFKVNAVNEYRYEIVKIKEGQIEKNEFFYDIENIEGNSQVKIFPYEGISKREVDARVTFDNLMYGCINIYYEGKGETCEYIFPDSDVRMGLFATPINMKKNIPFEVVEITSSIYKEKIYESIQLKTSDGKTVVWIIENIPLPVRIEHNENDIITIANLKNYN